MKIFYLLHSILKLNVINQVCKHKGIQYLQIWKNVCFNELSLFLIIIKTL